MPHAETGEIEKSTRESNTTLARRWLEALNQRDGSALKAMMSDSFRYSCMGRAPSAIAVRWDNEQFVSFAMAAHTRMRVPVTMSVVRALAEGNRVTLETQGEGEIKDGVKYSNSYCLLFDIDEGRVSSVREYCCSRTAVVASSQVGGLFTQ
jgi:uncharacterized protein